MSVIKSFLKENYRHFNAASLVDAAEAWDNLLAQGGKMLLTMGGAMSTAEMGISVAELIRQEKVHALCVTGANLEEDVFNLVAHNSYVRVPNYRELSAEQEVALLERGLNRVTDTCIPEEEAMRKVERHMIDVWSRADARGHRAMPYEHMYELLNSKVLEPEYEIDPKNSWLLAACAKNLPVWSPGWEDSTLANMFVSHVLRGRFKYSVVKSGVEQMGSLVGWYQETAAKHPIGFFQIAGGIAGDFPICVVPLIAQDLKQSAVRRWAYFCQISDSTTSFGSYSGAVPNEKITWGKLDVSTPKFVIESDASIVFPLVAAYVLGR